MNPLHKIKRVHGDVDIDSIHAHVLHEKGHSLERVWYIASRKPSDAPPRVANINISHLHICTQRHSNNIYNTVLFSQGFQVFISTQPTPLGESLGRSNQRGSKTSQACYGHPRCNPNLVRLFRFLLPLPVFGRPFSLPSLTRP